MSIDIKSSKKLNWTLKVNFINPTRFVIYLCWSPVKRIFVVAYILFADNDGANRNHVFGSLYPMIMSGLE